MRRILFDQGMPFTAAAVLGALGWDAVHVSELSMQQAMDTEILAYAARKSRAIITLIVISHRFSPSPRPVARRWFWSVSNDCGALKLQHWYSPFATTEMRSAPRY
jgi:Domain of unknown function (DUF5615)